MKTLLPVLVGVTLALASAAGSAEETDKDVLKLSIERKSLRDALNDWAQQTGYQLIAEIEGDLIAPQIEGRLTAQEALERLLEGTSLTYQWMGERLVAVKEKSLLVPAASQTRRARERVEVPRMQLAQLGAQGIRGDGDAAEGQSARPDAGASRSGRKEEVEEVEEVIVTGTHIRGISNPTSTVFVYNREDIENAGAGSVADFVSAIPQNFSSDGPGTQTFGNTNNKQGATSINLRGVGAEGTLVLVNGRRLAPAVLGDLVDVSFIPVAAIERIEVMPDGASAIYGSDAVAGVVNFVLRTDYEGAETRIRSGWMSHSDAQQLNIAQSVGKSWGSGSALLALDYHDSDELDAADRSYSQAPLPTYLLPNDEGHAFLGSARQRIGERTTVHLDGIYSDSEVVYINTLPSLPTLRSAADTVHYSFNAGVSVNLSANWSLDANATASSNELDRTLTGSIVGEELYKARVSALDVKTDGRLLDLPAGPLSAALGLGIRREEYQDRNLNVDLFGAGEFDRDVAALFAELYIPLLGARESARVERLALSLAGRYENYSDAGDTFDPKVGLVWHPTDNFKVHGTFATSFNTARYFDTLTAFNGVIVESFPSDACATGTCLVVSDFGQKQEYKPETSRSYTLGLEYRRDAVVGMFFARADYYELRYEDRIGTPPFPDVMVASASAFDDLVTENPSLDFVNEVFANAAGYANGVINIAGDFDPAAVDFYVDQRATNLATTKTSGIDIDLGISIPQEHVGEWQLGISGNHIFEIENQLTEIAPVIDVVDTLGNATRTRVRAHLGLVTDWASLHAFVNYRNSYVNDRAIPDADIGSWTTLDLTARISFDDLAWFGSGLKLGISARNVLDKDPPFALLPAFAIGFDPTNANAEGRVLSLEITKEWGKK